MGGKRLSFEKHAKDIFDLVSCVKKCDILTHKLSSKHVFTFTYKKFDWETCDTEKIARTAYKLLKRENSKFATKQIY